jgi:hypothetical protein
MEYSATLRRGPNLRYLRKQQPIRHKRRSEDDNDFRETIESTVRASHRRHYDVDPGSSSAPPGPPPSRPPPGGPPPPPGPPPPRRPSASYIYPNRRRSRSMEGPPPAHRRATVTDTEPELPDTPRVSSTNANRNPDLHMLAQHRGTTSGPVAHNNLVLCVYRNSKKGFDMCEVKLAPHSSKALRDRHLFRRMRKQYEYNLRGWIRGLFSFKSITTVRLLQVNNN